MAMVACLSTEVPTDVLAHLTEEMEEMEVLLLSSALSLLV